MLALFAHDLRNPLTAMLSNLSFAESLPAVRDDDSLAGALGDCIVASESLRRIIANLDVVAQLLEGFETTPRLIVIADLVRESVAKLEPTAAITGTTFDIDEGPAELEALADLDFATHAIENLLSCSLKDAPPGQPITVRVRAEPPDFVRVEVEDSGRLVSAAEREDFFSADGQLRAKTGPRYGRGVGFFIAAVAASAIDGDVAVEDARRPNGELGCRFVLRLRQR